MDDVRVGVIPPVSEVEVRLALWSVVALAAVLLSTSGCAATTTGQESTVLRVVMADDWASAPAVTDVVSEFEADHAGVMVEMQAAPFSQIPELVGGAIDAGESYDVAHWHAFAAASADLAEPLDDLWVDAGIRASDYLPGAVTGVTWREQRYGVPLDTNALVLLVNEPLVRAAMGGEPTLETLEGFARTVDAVSTDGRDGYALAVSSSSWTAYGWIAAHGGSLVAIDSDGVPTFTFEDPATVQALEFLNSLVRENHAPRPFAPDLEAEAIQSFSAGDHAMHVSGSWDLPRTWRAPTTTSISADEVAVHPLPQARPEEARTVLGGSSLFVPVGSRHRELAFAFMLRLTEDDVALRLVTEEGRLPARMRVLDDERFRSSPDLAAFVEQLEHAEVMELIAYPDVAAAFREGLESVLSGRQSVDEAMADVQRYAETWLEETGG